MESLTAVRYIKNNLRPNDHNYLVLGGEEYVSIKHLYAIIEKSILLEKKTVWVVLYKNLSGSIYIPHPFDSENEALIWIKDMRIEKEKIIKIQPIEIEL